MWIVMWIVIVLLAMVWASWHLALEWMHRTKPPQPHSHCCACDQFAEKCDAMKEGVTFYEGPDPK